MNQPPRFPLLCLRSSRLLLLGSVALAFTGCNFIHNYGSGSHLDAPPEKASHPGTAKASTMQIEVVTDAVGQVASVNFIRSSGSNAVDNFVADSIRHNWPGGPSKRSVVEVHYAPGTGFSEPRLLSSVPAA